MDSFQTSPANFYAQERRRRRWAQGAHGLQGYAEFLNGYGDGEETGALVGAGAAALNDATGSPAWRSIGIGVATGVITFLANHWLGKMLK